MDYYAFYIAFFRVVRIGRNLLVAKGDWEKRIILSLIYLVFVLTEGGGGERGLGDTRRDIRM